MTFWKSQAFKALQKDWYKRLEASGFRDVEKIVGDDMRLREFNPMRSRDPKHADNKNKRKLAREMKELYYRLIYHHVQEAIFPTFVDELIMTWHADGRRIKDICAELEKFGEKRCRVTVRITIRRYEMAWGMREYTPKQLNRKVG